MLQADDKEGSMMDSKFWVLYFGLFFQTLLADNTGIKPYCEGTSFSAECEPGSVVVMETAQYGRMRTGTCLKKGYGNIGCFRDVLTHLDSWCSGRGRCDVRVSAIVDAVTSSGRPPCSSDLRSFLEASYTCQPVITTSIDECYINKRLHSNASSGFLSNAAEIYSHVDPQRCPWVLEAPVGHRFNLTLHNFQRSSGSPADDALEVCHIVAMVSEPRLGTQHTICAGASKTTHAYTSHSEIIQVEIVRRPEEGHFLLEFDVTGCGDPQAPSNGWYERVNDVTAILRCHGSVHSGKATCLNGTWTGKDLHCPLDKQSGTMDKHTEGGANAQFTRSVWNFINGSQEITIALIISVAGVVGALILLAGLVYIRRKSKGFRKDSEESVSPTAQETTTIYSTDLSTNTQIRAKDIYEEATMGWQQVGNDYHKTWRTASWDRSHTGSTAAHKGDKYSRKGDAYHVHARSFDDKTTKYKFRPAEHIYESPPFDRKFPAYHELEPSQPARNPNVDNLL